MRNKKKHRKKRSEQTSKTTSVASVRNQTRQNARQTPPKDATATPNTDTPAPPPPLNANVLGRTSLDSANCHAYCNFFRQGLRVLTGTEVRQLRRKGYKVILVRKLPTPAMPTSPNRSLNVERIKTRVRRKAYCSNRIANDTNDEDTPACPHGANDDSTHKRLSPDKTPSATPQKGNRRKGNPEKICLVIVYQENNYQQLIKNLFAGKSAGTGDVSSFSCMFNKNITEQDLADCFHQIYDHFYGKDRTVMLRGQYAKAIDLVALLYVLMNDYNLCSEKLAVKPFHEFIKSTVITELGPCHRTLSNRLNTQFETLLKRAKVHQGFSRKRWKPQNLEEENYVLVCEFFCKTPFFKNNRILLKRLVEAGRLTTHS